MKTGTKNDWEVSSLSVAIQVKQLSNTETPKILRPFDMEIPPSGRV
jgi:hypothetical protein